MAMKIVRFNCCGMDVHKNLVVATIGITDRKTNVTEYFQRSFSTLNSDLYRLKDWLRSHHCSDVCMESTGKYWIPIFNILEDEINVHLTHPKYVKAIKGKKTDKKDSKWICDLFKHDLMLPKIDGFGVCELIRRESSVPILMLTALDGEQEQLRGFQMEIDDYVTKPFSMPILLQKIRAILRRTAGGMENNKCLHYRDLTLDSDGMEAVLAGRSLDLTTREFELLQALISSPGRVFTREVLLAKLWGYDFFGDERVVDSHIKNLRHKMGTDYIETVRGVGYRAAKENP